MIETNRLKIYSASKEQMEAFIAGQTVDVLKAAYTETEFVNLPMTHSWSQRVLRFYDLDGNLIEVGTPMK